MDEKIKTRPLHFPAKKTPNMEKTLFHWPIVLQYVVKAKYQVFSPERSLNQPKATRVCIISINQSNRSISVLLLFLCCWRHSRSSSVQHVHSQEYSLVALAPTSLLQLNGLRK